MGVKEQHNKIFEEAMEYVRLGLPIIPLCPYNHAGMSYSHRVVCQCAGKAPILENWTEHTNTSEDEAIEWFSKNNQINIGLPLGKVSSIVGIDIDGSHGEEELNRLSQGDLPPTWEFTTGGGRRLLYRIPQNVKTKKFRHTKQDEEHQELAILCEGQQTVLPPSIHYTGKVYKWVEGHSPVDIPIATAPPWVLKRIVVDSSEPTSNEVETSTDLFPDLESEPQPSDLPKTSSNTKERPTVTAQDWQAIVTEGQRNNHLTKLAGSLLSRRNIPKEEVFLFLKVWNQEHCKLPLPEVELRRMIDTLAASEAMKSAKKVRQNTSKQAFRPTPLAQLFINVQKDLGFSWKYATDLGNFYKCDDSTGPWQRIDTVLVQKAVREVITDESKGGSYVWDSTHYVNEVVDALKELLATTYEDGSFDIGQNARMYQDVVFLENGVLEWATGKLRPWDSSYLTTIQLPVRWEEEATCPTWETALEEWLPDEGARLFLQEYVGLCLIPDTSFRTAVFLYGSGANGKSLFLEGVKMLFGNSLVSIPIHRLADRFEVANLQNKLVNICGDIDSKYLSDTGMLKALIGGDTLRGEFKHGKSFDFIPVCRLMFSANALPRVSDKSEAWYSRWRFVEFPKTFPVNASYKLHLLSAFEKEKSGILRWAVEGLRRLKEHNSFTISKSLEEASAEYKEANDSVVAFVKDCLASTSEPTMVTVTAIYLLYKEWCEVNGFKAVGQIEFSKRMQQLGFRKERKSVRSKTCMCFLNVIVNEDWVDSYRAYEGLRR